MLSLHLPRRKNDRGIDVWRSVWRCTHAKLAPLTPHPLAQDRHNRPVLGQRGKHFGAGNLSAPISPLLLKCANGATTHNYAYINHKQVLLW